LFQPIYGLADFNFAAAGDWGCTSNTDATVSNINGKNPVRLFGLGDYSYASTGTCWFNKIAPIDSITKITIGNHEDDSAEGFSEYMSHFGLSQTYYSFDHQNVHVLVMDTDKNSYSSGSAQKNFVQSDLQSASTNPNIKWIIVYLHKPMYVSPNTCGSSSCSNTGSENSALRDGFHSMFEQYGVDLVLQGHVHNYERTFPLKYNPASPSNPNKTSSNANDYTNPEGQVFAIVGTGGVNFHALSGKASFVSSQQDNFFGQLDIKFTNNGEKLEGKFYRNDNGDVLDSFSIAKAIAPPSPPVANNQDVTTNKNTAKPITLTATDLNNDPLIYSIVTQPTNGTLSGTAPNLSYTPIPDYVGPDSFTFKANDGTFDSNIGTVSITVQDVSSCGNTLPITGITASGNQKGYPPSNVLDNNLNTRWSSKGVGQFIRADLGSIQNICSIDIAWYKGNERVYNFAIATSTDGTTFTNALASSSSGTTLNSEKYIISSTNARYVRVTVNGNSVNNYAQITELDIFGPSAASLSSTYNYEPSLTLSGPGS
jgi:F5/8 type C domain/Bacterial Ig domain/Calcineurin-like phosphoesterase